MPNRHVLAAALASALVAAPALAQTPIRIDHPLQGALSSSSPRADDNTPYDLYVYRGPAGQRIRISMTSSAFDAYLAVGTEAAPGCSADCKTDDDGGEGTDSSMTYAMPASGQVQIRANSIGANDAGPYTLAVTELPRPAPARVRAATLGQDNAGSFGDSTARDDEDKPFELWTIRGRAGQRLQIRMESTDFDSYLHFGSMDGDVFVSSAFDDDGGQGLNARLNVTLDDSGRGVVKTTAVGSDARGSYTLRIAEPPAQRPITPEPLPIGEAKRGRLDDADPFTPDTEIRFDVYTIEGRPGQRVTVRMESSDFDPLLKWGTFDGDRFSQDAMDDDGGGGNSAQLTVTLDADGQGRLVATGYSDAEGTYTLTAVGAAR